MTAYTMQNAHHEIALEQHLADQLIATQGYISRKRRIMTGRSPSIASWSCNS